MSESGYPADWPAPSAVRSWQSTRSGGVSRDAWSSLNLALHVGDRERDVRENRDRLCAALELPAEPLWLEQVHGSRILDLDCGESGPADGAVISKAGVVLAVMTADCMPILLASRDGQRIGAVHAGWRGLAAGVIGAAVRALRIDPAEILAWLGPAIGQQAFEVGAEVRTAFLAADPDAGRHFRPNARGRWQADLYGLAKSALERAGIAAVYGKVACTCEDSARYFSHRREAPCGRMATLIWRE